MRPFHITTSLDFSIFGHEGQRLSTRIRREGQDDIGQYIELGRHTDGRALEYALEHHFYAIKQFILSQSADQLYKQSPEYQRMQREIEERDRKLDDIADISDPDERG